MNFDLVVLGLKNFSQLTVTRTAAEFSPGCFVDKNSKAHPMDRSVRLTEGRGWSPHSTLINQSYWNNNEIRTKDHDFGRFGLDFRFLSYMPCPNKLFTY